MVVYTPLLFCTFFVLLASSILDVLARPGGAFSSTSSRSRRRPAAPPTLVPAPIVNPSDVAPPAPMPAKMIYRARNSMMIHNDKVELVKRLKATGYRNAAAETWVPRQTRRATLMPALWRQMQQIPAGSRQFIPLHYDPDAVGSESADTKQYALPLTHQDFTRLGLTEYADHYEMQTAAVVGVNHSPIGEHPKMFFYGFTHIHNAHQLHEWLPTVPEAHDYSHDMERVLRLHY